MLRCHKNYLRSIEASPSYQTPQEVTSFSTELVDGDAEYQSNNYYSLGDRRSKYFTVTQLGRKLCTDRREKLSTIAELFLRDREDVYLNIFEGFANQDIALDKNECMVLFLQCLKEENLLGKSDFVCRRGLLTKICETPYIDDDDERSGIIVSIQKVGSTYYMREFETENNREIQRNVSLREKKCAYGGKKFETLVTNRRDGQVDGPQNFNDEYVSVRSAKLGEHSLIIRGEIDGRLPDSRLSYVELKTTTATGRDPKEDPKKARKWWLQSHLIGTEKILCGYRQENGVVDRVKHLQVDDFCDQDSTKYCFLSLKTFLDFVKKHIVKEYQPYYLHRYPGSKSFTLHEDSQGKKYKFLPMWLLDHYIQIDSRNVDTTVRECPK